MTYKGQLLLLPPNRVWRTYPGGRTLDEISGAAQPDDTHWPEDWIGSTVRARNVGREDVVEGVSRVLCAGEQIALPDLLAADEAYFLGDDYVRRFGRSIMVLVKFLDSAVRLHVQCHPTIAFARERLGSNSGKTEAYHILGSREGNDRPYIYLGFQHPPPREEFRRMIEQQDLAAIEACFQPVPVCPGETYIIPGGLPHAIGAGVFMIEVMEPTDYAVRIEFEKAGYVLPESARFMDRGIDFALDMFDYTPLSVADIHARYRLAPEPPRAIGQVGRQETLIGPRQTPCFAVRKTYVRGVASKAEASFYIGIVSAGACEVRTDGGRYSLKTFDKFFAPHGLGEVAIESPDGVEIVECYPPSANRKDD